MMPRNQQSNHEMAVLHYSLQNINGVRTLQTDVQQGFKILPNGFFSPLFLMPCHFLNKAENRRKAAA